MSFYVAVLKCTCHIFYFVNRNNYSNELKKKTKRLILKKTQAHKNKIPHYLLKISFVVSYYERPIFKFLYHCSDGDRNRISSGCNRIYFMAVNVTPLQLPAVSHLGRTTYWQTQTHSSSMQSACLLCCKLPQLLAEFCRLRAGWNRRRRFRCCRHVQTGSGAHPTSYSMGVKLTADLHILLRLRMIGTIPLFSLYAVTAWTGTTTPSTLNFILWQEAKNMDLTTHNSRRQCHL